MTTHLVGFCHLSRERHQNDRTSLCVPCEVWWRRKTNLGEQISKYLQTGAILDLAYAFSYPGLFWSSNPCLFYRHLPICLLTYFTGFSSLVILRTRSHNRLCSWSYLHILDLYIDHALPIGSHVNTGLICSLRTHCLGHIDFPLWEMVGSSACFIEGYI